MSIAQHLGVLAEQVKALELEAADLRRENKRLRNQVARLTRDSESQPAAAPSKPWELLGVKPGADAGEVMAAFRRQSKIHHPDADTGDRELFEQLVAARDTMLSRCK